MPHTRVAVLQDLAHCAERAGGLQVLAMYHGDGGNLKNAVRGMTNHSKRLPAAEKNKMLEQKRRPVMMSVAQQEAAVLGDTENADPEDPLEKDPEDPDAVAALRKGDEALHDGDMDEAVKLCASSLHCPPSVCFQDSARVQDCNAAGHMLVPECA